jgi:hypothetical protein
MRNSPLPIGYIEVQKSFTRPMGGGLSDNDIVPKLLEAARSEVAKSDPSLVPHGSRMEMIVDAANVVHCNLYIGFAPETPTTEPLDPRNLNATPAPTALPVTSSDPGGGPLGMKETKF